MHQDTLDHCCTVLTEAYLADPSAALGLRSLLHLIPTYRQNLKPTGKLVVQTVRKWTEQSKQEPQACFGCTDWSVFEASATDLDRFAETHFLHQFL